MFRYPVCCMYVWKHASHERLKSPNAPFPVWEILSRSMNMRLVAGARCRYGTFVQKEDPALADTYRT